MWICRGLGGELVGEVDMIRATGDMREGSDG
jgi:hypothetical protein